MKLPIGIQTFSEIRERNLLYVDKTRQIHDVISVGKYFFMSRPRRFGKSLLLSTMRSLYEGQKALFEGLWIYDQWNWDHKCPVIHIQFSKSDYQGKGLKQAIINEINENAARLGIELQETTVKSAFFELIQKASQKNNVVILIDEYDKPIIDYLDDIPQANNNREILKSFYSILKDSDPYLELVFITGVSRFAKTSIFSDLNNLMNLSMHPLSMDLLGITPDELESYFSEAIQDIAKQQHIATDTLKEQIRHWYNGYSWNGVQKVYNPFSLLSYFVAKEFKNFWFETGTPTFLVKTMRRQKIFNINQLRATDTTLDSFDIEALNTTTILFQTGYLTIDKKLGAGAYQLQYPNHEVKQSLEEYLINAFSHDALGQGKIMALDIAEGFKHQDIDSVIRAINSVFSTIPSNLWQKDNEAFYHALIHLTFSLVGVFVTSEINSSNGRLDAKVETQDNIYILEFKLDQSAEAALQQIHNKQYFKPYANSSKQKIGIGINFSKTLKEVEHYLVEAF